MKKNKVKEFTLYLGITVRLKDSGEHGTGSRIHTERSREPQDRAPSTNPTGNGPSNARCLGKMKLDPDLTSDT